MSTSRMLPAISIRRESIQVTLGQDRCPEFRPARGQEDTLEGIVVDEQDNPLPGVELSLEDNSYYEEGRKYEHHQTTSTDASGFFKFDTGYYMMKLTEPQGSSYVHHIFLRAFRNEPEYTTSIPIVVSNAPSEQTIASAGHYEEQRSYPLGAKNIKIVKRRQSHIPDHMFESFMDYVNFQGVRDPGEADQKLSDLVLPTECSESREERNILPILTGHRYDQKAACSSGKNPGTGGLYEYIKLLWWVFQNESSA